MAKLKNPLNSLRASGSLGKALSFVRRRGRDLVEKRPVPTDARSEAQVSWRTMFGLCKDLWHELSAAEKAVWEAAGTARHMTGYAWYLSQCLRPNPGIYLPLAGGEMSGTIAMDGHSIEDLPAPVAATDAVRKSYVDALDPGEGHIFLLPQNYDAIDQGVWLSYIQNVSFLNEYFENSSGGNGDGFTLKVYLGAGTYTLRTFHRKASNRGIYDIDIDGVEVESIDGYAAGITPNQVDTETGITIAASGLKDFTLRIDGKNGSSSGFYCSVHCFALWRTS